MDAGGATRVVRSLSLGAVVGVAAFLLFTIGPRLSGTGADGPTDYEGYLPTLVQDPPPTVKTTDEYGPPGPIAMVFAAGEVESGLTGTLARSWITVSGLTGDYRAVVAPHLPDPEAGAMAVSPDGGSLAWAHRDGLVLYDTVRGNAVEVPLGTGAPLAVGRFSPDGRLLTAYGGGVLHVVDVDEREVVGDVPNVDARTGQQTVWTPDGTGLTHVVRGRLVTRPWGGGPARHGPTGIAGRATLAWHPSGERIAATHTTDTGTRVQLFEVRGDGRLEPPDTIAREGHSLQRMLGFSSETSVAGIGLGLETGPLPRLYRMSTESSRASDVTQLPAEDRVVTTLEVAAEPLQNGSKPFPSPDWPISDVAKLVISIVTAVFVAGLALTRRPRQQRRLRGH